ncbi:YitT family protein [Haloferula chungangensis]|uniref:YitT family protein n=1 Tax=Haloferula chungangensis TaxID=1048331 RepID=A0ABW2LAT9_9BACT
MPKSSLINRLLPTLQCLGIIGAGLMYAITLKYFVFPSTVILTGFEGIAAASSYYFDDPSLFLWIYAIAQTLLLIFAFLKISKTFAFRTFLTVGTVTAALVFLPEMEFASPEPQNERIILVLFGGILAGLSKAMALRLRGSVGDEDILAAWFAMKYLKPVGRIGIAAGAVSTTYGVALELIKSGEIEQAVNTLMYTAIFIFASAETLNNFFRKFKLVVLTAFAKDYKPIGDAIVESTPHRTYTVQDAVGGFSEEPVQLVRTIVTHEELPQVLDAIRSRSPDAFWFHHDIEGISNRYHIEPIG